MDGNCIQPHSEMALKQWKREIFPVSKWYVSLLTLGARISGLGKNIYKFLGNDHWLNQMIRNPEGKALKDQREDILGLEAETACGSGDTV